MLLDASAAGHKISLLSDHPVTAIYLVYDIHLYNELSLLRIARNVENVNEVLLLLVP